MKDVQPDPRWNEVTVRQCLQHTGGWDREKSYDPIVKAWEIAKAFDIEPPIGPEHVVRYMMGQPLDFDPGERYAYANLDYLILGRIIEAISGQKYDEFVKANVFGPLGIKSTRLGRALAENRATGEVRYYDREARTGPALYPPKLGEQVPVQYGVENLEAYEAHGGWIPSAVELVKFAAAFDDPNHCPLLKRPTIDQMWSRPTGSAGQEADGSPKAAYYGCGWMVRPVGNAGKLNAWHTGRIAGTETLLVRRWDGLTWAVLFNTAFNPDGKSLSGLIDPLVHQAADRVKVWPDDQFSAFELK
jgi:N-acyl-D-amino-acid deacylase